MLLQGPRRVVEQIIAEDPALLGARRGEARTDGATGALAKLATHAPGSKAHQALVELDEVGLELFRKGQLADRGDGFMRLVGRAADATFTAHGAVRPLILAPQEVLTAQMALTTLALTAAIKEVQVAVERVEDKVDLLQDLIHSARAGEILGAHRSLSRRADQVGFDGSVGAADWHAIDDVGIAVEQQIESLRSFVRKRLTTAEDKGIRISDRRDALDDVKELSEGLALLIVAQDSLYLFQQLRLSRIRGTEIERLDAALTESNKLLADHRGEDYELLRRVREVVAQRVTVRALEIHHFRVAPSLVEAAREVDAMLTWFADQRLLPYDPIELSGLPGIADAAHELRDRGTELASEGRHLAGSLVGRVNGGRKGAKLKLDDSHSPAALPPPVVGGSDVVVDSQESSDESPESDPFRTRFSKGRSAVGSRLARRPAARSTPSTQPRPTSEPD